VRIAESTTGSVHGCWACPGLRSGLPGDLYTVSLVTRERSRPDRSFPQNWFLIETHVSREGALSVLIPERERYAYWYVSLPALKRHRRRRPNTAEALPRT
jgi:hypothetical protein